MPTTRVRRTETSITRHRLRYTCARTHHVGYVVVETQWADGEGGVYRAYRCSNCEATWVDQHISAEQPSVRGRSAAAYPRILPAVVEAFDTIRHNSAAGEARRCLERGGSARASLRSRGEQGHAVSE